MALINKLNNLQNVFRKIPQLVSTRSFNIFTKQKSVTSSLKRTKSIFPKFRVNEQYYIDKDNIPHGFNLIYRNGLSNYLVGAQIVSVVGAAIVGIYVWYAETTIEKFEPYMPAWKNQPMRVDNEILFFLSSILALSVILQYFIKKMPIRIYNFQDNKYVFVYYNVFPGYTKKASCGLKEIRKLKDRENPILPWTNSRYEVHKNYGTIIMENFFKNPSELHIMLGIQKRFVEE